MHDIRTLLADLLDPPKPFISFDPGLEGTGWAYFRSCEEYPAATGVIHARQGTWQSRAHSIAVDASAVILAHESPPVLIEWPGFWGGSLKSMAAVERGDLFKLCYLIGAMCRDCKPLPRLIAPIAWKGQLSKEAVKRRINKLTLNAMEGLSSHTVDAIGIGFALGGRL